MKMGEKLPFYTWGHRFCVECMEGNLSRILISQLLFNAQMNILITDWILSGHQEYGKIMESKILSCQTV